MNKLQAGFAKLNINPPMGTPINGYYIPRHVEGYLDDLEVVALALKVENTTVVMLSVDTCIISTSIAQLAHTLAQVKETTQLIPQLMSQSRERYAEQVDQFVTALVRLQKAMERVSDAAQSDSGRKE